ncbi:MULTISPECIES: CatA-like O-acetyltransferase [Clostridium]|uniref:Chloramphenicol acetyltransferase n=1 Tax=Clostridium beijerinckii TaxID=1520 RepID=A0A1S9N2T4_CLOBE|nr:MULTISPECIES: CatA-like O-acetyltransferase [Clostridium]MBN7573323.1 chloramphenicol acetyltransferase CAT [Clostridium beijerinckii]MBN7578662.1 chloramphenicol acetyltransferase CAT [Clostridium beijerinckii]MBN7583096.1 chloramphenicol acetyltransferase CAT [Clostridium beijerinckii]MBO0519252.1 chloramphenicol acetyltransferase CAT [Clostridium beijerinckii]MZK49222.1 chloramphenicol acetyltransferase CAT [Clostridium beijerinckii]
MGFNVINMNTWVRKECFNHFFNNAKCTYSITVNIDITNLYNYIKTNELRFYPTFTWVVSKAINSYEEFKMAFDEEGKLGFFDEIGPSYSVLNDGTKVMSDLYTPFNNKFLSFYGDMENSLNNYKQDANFTTKYQNNFFIVSCLPWFDYTSFNVNNEGSSPFLFPMVTWGKFFEEGNKIIMPVTIQVHHAVADGYHCSLFFSDVKEISLNPELYLK